MASTSRQGDDMKTGRIDNNEKYAIQGMYADNKTAEEIAKALDRSVKIVTNYLEKLDKIHETVAKVQIEASKASTEKAGYAVQRDKNGVARATIATPGSSQRGDKYDSSGKLQRISEPNNQFDENIFLIKENKLKGA